MIPVKIKVIGIMMLCGILLNGCTGSAYINNSTEQADIKLSGETFDVTADECIEILNEDIKKEELDLIPTEYEVDEQEDKIVYRCVINDILMNSVCIVQRIWFRCCSNCLVKGGFC